MDGKKYYSIFLTIIGWCILTIFVLQFSRFFEIYGKVNVEMLNNFFNSISEKPFENLQFTKQGLKFVIYFSALYFLFILGLKNNYKFMPGKEHGSAEWAKRNDIKKVIDKETSKNIILTTTEGISIDCRVPGVNLNTIVIGGSGTGKTRFFLKPNLMQMYGSYVITDPKGEILRDTAKMLTENGYKVRTLNLVDMVNSNSYNPFEYLREGREEDVMTLIKTIMLNTNDGKKTSSAEPFWEKAEMLFLQAIFFYLVYEAPKNEQNIPMVMELIRAADVREEDEGYESGLDILFKELELEKGEGHIAVIQYRHFKSAAGKTAKSIIISAAARLAPYNIDAVKRISLKDEMNLSEIGEEKTALFIIISPSNTTFNFIAAMLYSQLFAELDYVANWKHDGKLPLLVSFLLDEFANVGQIPNFEKILAYGRSLGLSIVPIFQSLSQLKEMYKDSWETIIDNCSSFLFLGGQGVATVEYVSKMLGKTTINTRTRGRTRGRQGSTNENINITGRELMTPTEVREMPSQECLLFIKGLKPFKSKKYDITKHRNYKKTLGADEKNRYEFSNKSDEKKEIDFSDLFQPSNEKYLILKEKYKISDLNIAETEVSNLSYEFDGE